MTIRSQGTIEGAPLGYIEYLPPDYGDDALSPLIVFLHGSGESGDGDFGSLAVLSGAGIPRLISTDNWRDEWPFVVLAPQHNDMAPEFCFTVEEIDEFIEFAMAHYDVDPDRVYLSGLSCGAIGAWNYLGKHADDTPVAAAALIAGMGYAAVDEAGCALGDVALWAFHGTNDESVPVRGSIYPLSFLNSCTDPAPVDARLTLFRLAGHDVWSRVYDLTSGYDIYSWFLSHSKAE